MEREHRLKARQLSIQLAFFLACPLRGFGLEYGVWGTGDGVYKVQGLGDILSPIP